MLPARAREVLHEVLRRLQEWLVEDSLAGSRLVFVTRGAVAVGDEGVSGLVSAGVWGLVRSACSEHPGRFGLVDVDGGEVSWDVLRGAFGVGERELAVRGGVVL